MSDPATVTQLLNAAQTGDTSAVDKLFPLIYDELRQRAHAQRAGFGGHATMNTTAIVHEAYYKLAQGERGGGAAGEHGEQGGGAAGIKWHSRAHFYAVAAKAMRHVFLDYAKRKNRKKRGEGAHHVSIDESGSFELAAIIGDEEADDIMALDAALIQLSTSNERAARIVECRFFGGMTVEDTAFALGLSPATVKRDWVLARVLLYQSITAQN
jgi:hypothetical protein